jgi:hypothetical protein
MGSEVSPPGRRQGTLRRQHDEPGGGRTVEQVFAETAIERGRRHAGSYAPRMQFIYEDYIRTVRWDLDASATAPTRRRRPTRRREQPVILRCQRLPDPLRLEMRTHPLLPGPTVCHAHVFA